MISAISAMQQQNPLQGLQLTHLKKNSQDNLSKVSFNSFSYKEELECCNAEYLDKRGSIGIKIFFGTIAAGLLGFAATELCGGSDFWSGVAGAASGLGALIAGALALGRNKNNLRMDISYLKGVHSSGIHDES